MNDLNVQVCSLAPSDVNLQRLGRQPFSYLPTYNNKHAAPHTLHYYTEKVR